MSVPVFAQGSGDIPCSENPDCVVLPTTTANIPPYIDDWSYKGNPFGNGGASNYYPGWGDWFGGGGGDGVSQAKKDYCKQLQKIQDTLNILLSTNSITGTASTGYSVAQGSADWLSDVLTAAYTDIEYYSRIEMHPPMSYTGGTIDWSVISWDLTGYSTYGSQHVFATWVKSVDQGDGSTVLTDPEPGQACP